MPIKKYYNMKISITPCFTFTVIRIKITGIKNYRKYYSKKIKIIIYQEDCSISTKFRYKRFKYNRRNYTIFKREYQRIYLSHNYFVKGIPRDFDKDEIISRLITLYSEMNINIKR